MIDLHWFTFKCLIKNLRKRFGHRWQIFGKIQENTSMISKIMSKYSGDKNNAVIIRALEVIRSIRNVMFQTFMAFILDSIIWRGNTATSKNMAIKVWKKNNWLIWMNDRIFSIRFEFFFFLIIHHLMFSNKV
jgi:hypothetical protein